MRSSWSWCWAVGGVIWLASASCNTPPPGGNPPDSDVIFRDEFENDVLDEGWAYDGPNPALASLTARPGFLRLLPGEPVAGDEDAGVSLLLREAGGDFVLVARVEFDPVADRQGAGLFIRGNDGRTVSFGTLLASGPQGTFRGLVAVAERAGGADPISQFEPFDVNSVTLRLERSGDEYASSFSVDGAAFTTLPLLRTDLSDAVEVGLGNFVGERCASECDVGSEADFDFFELGRIPNTEGE